MPLRRVHLFLGVICLAGLVASQTCPKKPSIEDRLSNIEKEIKILSKSMTAKLTKIERKVSKCFPACPRGWRKFRRSCYRVHRSVKTWHQARAVCLRHRADLVKITSKTENNFVLKLSLKYAKQRKQMWIGLKFSARDRKYHWVVDNSLPRYTKWAPHEPNGFEREKCGHMWTDRSRKSPARQAGDWNDLPCAHVSSLANGFICEKKARRV